jgi:hypothetical protein
MATGSGNPPPPPLGPEPSIARNHKALLGMQMEYMIRQNAHIIYLLRLLVEGTNPSNNQAQDT